MTGLALSIEGLYRALEQYGVPPHVLGCAYGVSAADERRIRSAPLRQLGAGDLERFAFKAMTTWGTVDDFRHFLPRIFELLAADGGEGWIDPETAFGKLAYGHWRTWPAAEQRAVERYTVDLWAAVTCADEHPFAVGSCLCSIGQAVDDLTPYLADWRPDRSRGEAVQFAAWVRGVYGTVGAGRGRPWRLPNPWWGDRRSQADQATEWLLCPDRGAELEAAFFAFGTDEATAEVLSYACHEWGGLRAAAAPPWRPVAATQ